MTPANKKLFKFFEQWIVSKTPNASGEWRMLCPIHGEQHPSATVNFEKGVFHCNSAKCVVGGTTIGKLKRMVEAAEDGDVGTASYDPFAGSNIVDLSRERAARKQSSEPPTKNEKPLTEGLVKAWHRGLMEDEKLLQKFMVRRGLTRDTIVQFEIGYDYGINRYIIPIRDASGKLVNARKYKPDADTSQKMWNHTGMGSPPRLFPIAVLQENEDILVVEGELDALICVQNGIPAVSGTGGAKHWHGSWNSEFAGKRVWISYDNDSDGRLGAKRAERSLRTYAKEVHILPPVMEEDKSDVSDFFLAGGTAEQLRTMMAASEPVRKPDVKSELEPTVIEVVESMDASTNGKPLAMTVSVTGCRYPTYSIPMNIDLSCTMDYGDRCKQCPMLNDHEGDLTLNVQPEEVSFIGKFVDIDEDRRLEVARKHIGAKKCDRLQMDVTEATSLNHLYIATNVDRAHTGRNDFTQRRAYAVGNYAVETNTVANMVGTTWPNPKTGENEFYAWSVEPAVTSIDQFQLTPEMAEQLRIFQPTKGQAPLEKAREIAHDMSLSVTQILGRERLHMCMDLVWHSILNFEFEGKVMDRSWLEFIVVGDTRTGKSRTAMQLAEHYGLGHVIGCESATFAGLVGGTKQIGKEWQVQWGEITINDRRLCVLDEASGLKHEIISRMSDVRSRGVAQVTSIETRQTRARCRLIWISNPRKPTFVDEKKTEGVDIIEDVVGNPEDIARFDLAMSVRSDDISNDTINVPREIPPPKYSSELCRNLILWCWSRKPEQVVWHGDAYKVVFEMARKLSEMYEGGSPLIQGASVKEKVVRIAAALAARTFSTDATATKLIIKPAHVRNAAQLLHQLYQYPNFGLQRRALRLRRNESIAKAKRGEIILWLRENRRILEFLMDRSGSFRAQDLEEMAFMHRDEVTSALGTLADAKMISKDKSQIVMEPELQKIIKEMEKRFR